MYDHHTLLKNTTLERTVSLVLCDAQQTEYYFTLSNHYVELVPFKRKKTGEVVTITCHVKELFLGRSLQVSVPLLVTRRQLSHLLFQPLELLKFLETVHLLDLVVERQVLDRRIDCLARLSTNPDALQTSLVDFLSQLISKQQVRSVKFHLLFLNSVHSLKVSSSGT